LTTDMREIRERIVPWDQQADCFGARPDPDIHG
jgi:hypothetical protein